MGRSRVSTIVGFLALTCPFTLHAVPDPILVGNFSAGDLDQWEPEVFSDKTLTQYSLVETESGKALQAISQQSASALIRKIHIDLSKTPYLNWSWRVDQGLHHSNEQTKDGDDFAARIYIIVSGGLAFWRTRALNYVWSNSRTKLLSWPNPYATDNVLMMAVRTGAEKQGQWQHEKRNLMDDLKTVFGESIPAIDAIAVMTDTDNTRATAKAYYGDIYFSAQ